MATEEGRINETGKVNKTQVEEIQVGQTSPDSCGARGGAAEWDKMTSDKRGNSGNGDSFFTF